MIDIYEIYEWRLIKTLGSLIAVGKVLHKTQQRPQEEVSLHPIQPYHDLFEVELRRVFATDDEVYSISDTFKADFKLELQDVCLLLDSLVKPEFTNGNTEAYWISTNESNVGRTYPRIKMLISYLRELNGNTECVQTPPVLFDLASGLNQTLFDLPEEIQLRRDLKRLQTYNDFIQTITSPHRSMSHSKSPSDNRRVWMDTEFRHHSTTALESLFRAFRCNTDHEVMLKMERISSDKSHNEVHVLLSSCQDDTYWQEASCNSYKLSKHMTTTEAVRDVCEAIDDVCEALQQGPKQGLMLHHSIRPHELYGLWRWVHRHCTLDEAPRKQSLDQLIAAEGFKTWNPFYSTSGVACGRFHTMQRRGLALRLGYCFMNFLDVEVNAKNTHLLFSSDGQCRLQNDLPLPYLSFPSILAVPIGKPFRVGESAFLSFAKLLLEIGYGDRLAIDLSIHDPGGNDKNWFTLLRHIRKLENCRDDSYLDAVRGCYIVYVKTLQALGPDGEGDAETYLEIRKHIYERIVSKLERGLNESKSTSKGLEKSEPPPTFQNMEGKLSSRRQQKQQQQQQRQEQQQRHHVAVSNNISALLRGKPYVFASHFKHFLEASPFASSVGPMPREIPRSDSEKD